jgi:hypothetical protein
MLERSAQVGVQGISEKNAAGVIVRDADQSFQSIDFLPEEKRVYLVAAANHRLTAPPHRERKVHFNVEHSSKTAQKSLVVAVFEQLWLFDHSRQSFQCEIQ